MHETYGSNLAIFPASETDLAAIADLARLIWRQYYPGIISDAQIEYMLAQRYQAAVMRQEMIERHVRYDRLLLNGMMIGFAAHGPSPVPGEWKLRQLYLLSAYHGQGFGKQGLLHVESVARTEGFHTVILTVNKNNHQARAVYTKCGFRIRQAAVFDVGGGFVMDDYVMTKVIPGIS